MLKNLHISNYALIENLDIAFSSGFSVITGETGSGKSIVLGAMGLLLGQRADTRIIKSGAAKCIVEGTFDVEDIGLDAFFQENDIDFDGHECIIRREITIAGKSRSFINDTPVPLAKLKDVGRYIIDIHSQHQNLLMGNEEFLLNVLDLVANDLDTLHLFKEKLLAWEEECKALELFKAQLAQDKGDVDYVRHNIRQVEEAQLKESEQEDLEKELQVLNHVEEIKNSLFQVLNILDSPEQSLLGQLRQGENMLRSISNIYPEAQTFSERVESCRIELEDLASEVDRVLERTELDPERLAYVESRLNMIYGLEERFRAGNVQELHKLLCEWKDRLIALEDADEAISQKEKTIKLLYEQLLQVGEKITEARQHAASHISSIIVQTLQFMGMPNSRLEFELTHRSKPSASGFDNALLLFSGNKNVPMQDVSLIASGGEVARLMLSLKALLTTYRHLPTVIFDEIDTGVSGTMAEKMGLVMQQMSGKCQVICITHLPQIAALGETHYRVYKTEGPQGTTSHIDALTPEERITEIANMLSGSQMTEAAMNNAKSLLNL